MLLAVPMFCSNYARFYKVCHVFPKLFPLQHKRNKSKKCITSFFIMDTLHVYRNRVSLFVWCHKLLFYFILLSLSGYVCWFSFLVSSRELQVGQRFANLQMRGAATNTWSKATSGSRHLALDCQPPREETLNKTKSSSRQNWLINTCRFC